MSAVAPGTSVKTDSEPKLTVSLIVHQDFSHIGPALRSLLATTSLPFRVMVTINTPNAPEIERLRHEFPAVEFIINQKPAGFAANHNRILEQATTAYVALLNDDIILHDGALDTLVAYLDTHATVGLVGPGLYNADGTEQVSYYSDPGLGRMLYKISGLAVLTRQQSAARRWLQRLGVTRLFRVESLQPRHRVPHPVPVIKGTAMVVRRAAYEQVGLMDETTLAYGEEVEWHWRLRQAGWMVVFVPEAKVTHFGTGQIQLRLDGQMLLEDRKAILNYFSKNRPSWQVVTIRVSIILAHVFWGIAWLPFSRQRARSHYQAAWLGATWHRHTEP